MSTDAAIQELVAAGSESIEHTKRQLELVTRGLPADRQRAMRLVFLKLDEARLWLGEVAR